MTSIPKLLSRQLNVRLNTKIIHIQVASRRWVLTAESGERFSGSHLLLTAPVPQSLALLEGCEFYIPAGSQEALQSIRYDLCIAALITLADRSDIPSPGGISFKEGPITWIADNYQKGISPMEHAITIHTSPEFSRDFWHVSDDLALGEILNSVRRWIPSEINHATLHRWRYSKPAYTPFETVLHLSGPPSLTFAGDAFGASRVEGAALSGLAAAKCLLEC